MNAEPETDCIDDDHIPEPTYELAVAVTLRNERKGWTSTSWLQRRLSTGYDRCALWLSQMEREGIVGPADDDGRRVVLLWRH